MQNIRPIETEADYDWALAEVARYFEREPAHGTAEAARFTVLLALIGHYEARHWPIKAPDPVEAIKSVIDSKVRTQTDLAKVLGSRSRASEVLSRRRPLTLEMVRKLSDRWKLPADLLIQPYVLKTRKGAAKKAGAHVAKRDAAKRVPTARKGSKGQIAAR
jgi:HTH-type transcriptional regulator / antitoxin HigA